MLSVIYAGVVGPVAGPGLAVEGGIPRSARISGS